MGLSRIWIDRISHGALNHMRKKAAFCILQSEAITLGEIGEAQSGLKEKLNEALTMIEWLKQKPVVVSETGMEMEDEEVLNEHLFRRVDELELSVRAANCLQNAGIEYIFQLVERTEADMLKTKNFGRKSLYEIKEILAEMCLYLGMKMDKAKLPENHPRWHPPDPDVLTDTNPHLLKPVEQLGLQKSTCFKLQNRGIFYIYELAEKTEASLWDVYCLNYWDMGPIKEALGLIQLALGMKIPKKPPQE
ncbi:TPA: hypothetical protein DDZ06_00785 [Candidatus Uhrbacteria bacterium]|nr:hypothetical protein [Candidatus Uhrbacteria bacterium]